MTNESDPTKDDKGLHRVNIGNVEDGIHGSTLAGRDVNELAIDQVIVRRFDDDKVAMRQHRDRLTLLQRVENHWIRGNFDKLLSNTTPMARILELQPQAVHHPWEMVVDTSDESNVLLPLETTVVDIFHKMEGSFLILGEARSGKTTMLLDLARHAIARARQDITKPIPVVFSFTWWTKSQQLLADWLLDEIKRKYIIPEDIARSWLTNDELFLLLDDLDKIQPQKRRERCVAAINVFHREHGLMPMVICCRSRDYEVLSMQLQLQGAICLKTTQT